MQTVADMRIERRLGRRHITGQCRLEHCAAFRDGVGAPIGEQEKWAAQVCVENDRIQ